MKYLMQTFVLAVLALSLGFGGAAWAGGKPGSAEKALVGELVLIDLQAGDGSGAVVRDLFHEGDFVPVEEDESALVVGKKGTVAFRTQTEVGDLTLPPGRYLVQHHGEDSEHFVRFRLLNPVRHDPFSGKGGRVVCSLEHLENKASRTAVILSEEDDVDRVIKLEVKGENVAHVF